MKVFFLLFTFASSCLFAQKQAKTVAHYQSVVKTDIFLIRWYSAIIGQAPYVYKQTLLLRSDGSFAYSFRGGECGTFDHEGTGTWTKNGKELFLQSPDHLYMLSKSYTIRKRRLYPSSDLRHDGAFRKKGSAAALGQ
jgi:hypothetical protein